MDNILDYAWAIVFERMRLAEWSRLLGNAESLVQPDAVVEKKDAVRES